MNELAPVVVPNLVSAPAWIQLAVMVNDGSGSMTLPLAEPDASVEGYGSARTKGAGVDIASRSLLERMKQSRMKANFQFSFVSFNDDVTERRPPQPLVDVPLDRSYDPTSHGVGGTAIHRGLDAAAAIVEAFMRDAAGSEVPVSAVVCLMSDGEEMDDSVRTADVAARLRALPNTSLAACLFATHGQPPAGEPLLKSLVSEPRLYQRVYDTEELRKFFHASITATGTALAVRAV